MNYVAFVLAIFGFLAYCEMSSLKKRIGQIEEQLATTKGTSYAYSRESLKKLAQSYIGKKVRINLREEMEDIDVISYGNVKGGANIILDVDDEWMLVRINGPKKSFEKLLRLSAVENLTVVEAQKFQLIELKD